MKGIEMSEGTKDEVKGKFHEVRAGLKRRLDTRRTIPIWKTKELRRRWAGRCRRKLGRWRRFSRSRRFLEIQKFGGG
jgi:hypothetical protein